MKESLGGTPCSLLPILPPPGGGVILHNDSHQCSLDRATNKRQQEIPMLRAPGSNPVQRSKTALKAEVRTSQTCQSLLVKTCRQAPAPRGQ